MVHSWACDKQRREQLHRRFGHRKFNRTKQSVVWKNCAKCIYFFAASDAKFWKLDISTTSERAFPDYFGNYDCYWTLSKKMFLVNKIYLRLVSVEPHSWYLDDAIRWGECLVPAITGCFAFHVSFSNRVVQMVGTNLRVLSSSEFDPYGEIIWISSTVLFKRSKFPSFRNFLRFLGLEKQSGDRHQSGRHDGLNPFCVLNVPHGLSVCFLCLFVYFFLSWVVEIQLT